MVKTQERILDTVGENLHGPDATQLWGPGLIHFPSNLQSSFLFKVVTDAFTGSNAARSRLLLARKTQQMRVTLTYQLGLRLPRTLPTCHSSLISA